jgi:hypothetical protein
VHEHGLALDVEQMEKGPGGKATVAVWRRQAAARAKETVDQAYANRKPRDAHVMISDDWVRLTKAEAKELADELIAMQERWQDRTLATPPGKGERRTYHLMQILQPAPEVES